MIRDQRGVYEESKSGEVIDDNRLESLLSFGKSDKIDWTVELSKFVICPPNHDMNFNQGA